MEQSNILAQAIEAMLDERTRLLARIASIDSAVSAMRSVLGVAPDQALAGATPGAGGDASKVRGPRKHETKLAMDIVTAFLRQTGRPQSLDDIRDELSRQDFAYPPNREPRLFLNDVVYRLSRIPGSSVKNVGRNRYQFVGNDGEATAPSAGEETLQDLL